MGKELGSSGLEGGVYVMIPGSDVCPEAEELKGLL